MGRIYVIRHGKAHKESASGHDADRELRERGIRQAEWLGARLAGADACPEVVISSKYARALGTARHIAEACGCEVELAPMLESGRPAEPVIEMIEQRGREGIVAIVGHNPQLSDLVEMLVRSPETDGIWLRTGQACVIDVEPGHATFVELMRLDE